MSQTPEAAFKKLIDIINTLMGENGCPWDVVQTRESLKPYLVEEAYETLEALDSNNPEKIKDELGDLMYQILFHSKISENRKEFNITQVIDNLAEKMVRRHPHVFDQAKADTPDAVIDQWEHIKISEKANQDHKSLLDSVPKHLPSLARAQKLTKKTAKHGFDWQEISDVFAKLDEEIAEFKEAVLSGKDADIADELGDILFVLVNIARHKKIDAPKKRYAAPTTNSSNAFNTSKRKCKNPEKPSKTPLSRKWNATGRKRNGKPPQVIKILKAQKKPRRAGSPTGVLVIRGLLGNDVGGLRAFLAVGLFELDRLAFRQGFESFGLNLREVNEHIFAIFTFNKSVSFAVVKPLYFSY